MLYESYHFISTPETEMVLVCMTGQTGPRPPKTNRFVWFGFIPGFGQSMHTSIIWEPYSFCGVKGHLRSLKVKIWNLCVRGSLIREVCAKKGAVCTVTRPVGFRDAWVFVQEISRRWQAGLEITMGLWHIRAKNCSNCTRKGQSGVYQMSVRWAFHTTP